MINEAVIWDGDGFFNSVEDLADHFERNDMFVEFEEEYELELEETDVEPIWKFTADDIADIIHSERFSEDEDDEHTRVVKILNDNIDFEGLNKKMPELCYGNGKKFKIRVGELKKMV